MTQTQDRANQTVLEQEAERVLKEKVREVLLGISYPAFVECVRQLLSAIGYTDISIERRHRKGRNSGGGRDLDCISPNGITNASVVAQIKQYRIPVQKRFVDELRGAMLRLGARQGLIVTTSVFSPVARTAASTGTVAPVRLVDGEELVGLMLLHGIGVTTATCRHRALDATYFAHLTQSQGVSARFKP